MLLTEHQAQADDTFNWFFGNKNPVAGFFQVRMREAKPLHYDDCLALCREFHLYRQILDMMWDFRLKVADSILMRITKEEAVTALMGEAPSPAEIGYKAYNQFWGRQDNCAFYNHVEDQNITINRNAIRYCKLNPGKSGFFANEWDRATHQWGCVVGSPAYLKVPIPFGILCKMKELASLKIFNDFEVVAPEDMFDDPQSHDPILLARIVKGEFSNDWVNPNRGDAVRYYVGRWDCTDAP